MVEWELLESLLTVRLSSNSEGRGRGVSGATNRKLPENGLENAVENETDSKMLAKIKAVTGSRTSKGSIFRKCQRKLKQLHDQEQAKAPYSKKMGRTVQKSGEVQKIKAVAQAKTIVV